MKSLQEHLSESLNEAKESDKIYVDNFGAFWLAYSPGSGTTNYAYSRGIKSVTNVKDDKHADADFCDGFIEATKKMKPHRKKKEEFSEIELFKIPVYNKPAYAENYDIWGGDIKPNKFIYVSWVKYGKKMEGKIIHFFETLREANGFHQF